MQKQAIHLLKNIVINANAGFEYYVQIFHQSMKDVTFSTTCEPTNDTNIDCTSAIDLRCNTSVPMYRNFLNQSQSCTSKNQVDIGIKLLEVIKFMSLIFIRK